MRIDLNCSEKEFKERVKKMRALKEMLKNNTIDEIINTPSSVKKKAYKNKEQHPDSVLVSKEK